MGDPDEEWRIQEYQYSEESKSKLGWIWDKGLRLGKKIAVTSIVVSSAPFVLPPLVVLSAVGVTFSVPCGFAIVSYACMERLMSRLLPEPMPPPLLDYGTMNGDEEKYRGVREDQNGECCLEDYTMGANEDEFEEDVKRSVEMRIELVDEGSTEFEEETMALDSNEGWDAVREDVDVTTEGDIGESLDRGLVASEILSGIREVEEELSSVEVEGGRNDSPATDAVLVVAEVGGKDDSFVERVEDSAIIVPKNSGEERGQKRKYRDAEEVLSRETTGLIEAIRDEGKDCSTVKANEQSMEENCGVDSSGELKAPFEHQDLVGNLELQRANPATDMEEGEGIQDEDKTKDMMLPNASEIPEEVEVGGDTAAMVGGSSKDCRDVKIAGDMKKDAEVIPKGTEVGGGGEGGGRAMEKDEEVGVEGRKSGNVFVIPEEVTLCGDSVTAAEGVEGARNSDSIRIETEALKNGGTIAGGDLGSSAMEKQKPIVEKRTVVHVKRSGNLSSASIHEEVSSDWKGATLFLPYEAREYMPDRGDKMQVLPSLSVSEKPKGIEIASGDIVDRNTGYLDLPISSGLALPKSVETATVLELTAGHKEESHNEGKIWDQILAMRTIVGYKAAPHASCVEELKALYVFTGVEPPDSDKDPCDLEDVSEKLHFLKSIIGVK